VKAHSILSYAIVFVDEEYFFGYAALQSRHGTNGRAHLGPQASSPAFVTPKVHLTETLAGEDACVPRRARPLVQWRHCREQVRLLHRNGHIAMSFIAGVISAHNPQDIVAFR
jgi:hypothetical protein